MKHARLKVRYRRISDLNLAPYNPRDITEEALNGLRESITKWGMVDPVVVNVRGGADVVVGGHQRIKVAQELGWDEVPTVDVDLGSAEEKALNVTLNNRHITGHFTDALQDLLKDIREEMAAELDEEEVGKFFESVRLDHLELPDEWSSGQGEVDKTESNLDGITATIKVQCPQENRNAVKAFLIEAISNGNIKGVQVV